jgi:hypothetical protein
MAISYKGGNRITGLSTDTRPDAVTSVDGSTFTETDTGKEYIKHYGDWSERNQVTDSVGLALNYANETNQHFWEWFTGKQIDSRWTITNWNSVTGAIAMDDNIDGGAKLTTSGNRSTLQFNNIRPYDYAGSEVIWVARKEISGEDLAVGLAKNSDGFMNGGVHFNAPTTSGGNSKFYALNNAGSGGNTDTGVAQTDAINWRVYKMTCATSSQSCSIDGVLRGSKTTTMDSAMQPASTAYSSSTNTHLRYCEAYNT